MIEGRAITESWELKVPFVISRSSRTHATVVYLEITNGTFVGRSECQPNTRYDETPDSVIDELNALFPATLENLMKAIDGLHSIAARNALDCALLDLEAKMKGVSVSERLLLPPASSVQSVYTISVGTPDDMAVQAKKLFGEGIRYIKLKLAGDGDGERVKAVRAAVPELSVVVDANEAWNEPLYRRYMPVMAACGVELVEQPFPADADQILSELPRDVPVCADESCHVAADVARLKNRYDAVNIKLDKAGGLREGRNLMHAARAEDMKVMVGCMLGTSLAMAPAYYLASQADYVDLDGPALLKKDRKSGLKISDDVKIYCPDVKLWG
ncbi:dipeptide epimerase [Kordiimonas laminariae]|uniref:dipeptide epimerase n=1 Tax=Kordiimonas laminariae TaxID=2917717 RepID=UPI001FF6E1CF|nr:dipeptide epimerase [Kordiimonas laminariae]MCK0069687.1 dipeptide epimerase [Kordiimonas laminariae]